VKIRGCAAAVIPTKLGKPEDRPSSSCPEQGEFMRERVAYNELVKIKDFELQYQDFLRWWWINNSQFDNLSFRINSQVLRFYQSEKNEGQEVALSQLRSDLFGYYLEYIKQEGIIPFTLRYNKSGRLVGEFYGDVAIVDLVDEREREGVVKQAMKDLEEKLKVLRGDEIIFRVSPSGWTNMGYDYTETQTQIFWRDEDKIRGLTIRSKVDLSKIKNFLELLGVQLPEVYNEKDLIKYITSLNITLPYPKDKFLEFLLKNFSQFDHRGKLLVEQFENWFENDGNFKHLDELSQLMRFLEEKIKDGLQRNDLSSSDLSSLLGFVLMSMAGLDLRQRSLLRDSQFSNLDVRYLPLDTYDRVFNHLQSLPGCAGGGVSLSNFGRFVLSSFGPTEITGNKSESNQLKCVNCPFCHKVVDADIIARNGKKFIHCPSCGAEVEMSS
jgi:ssDNA-binding Zn-finger/Zn-ribbon topoisomerase 1